MALGTSSRAVLLLLALSVSSCACEETSLHGRVYDFEQGISNNLRGVKEPHWWQIEHVLSAVLYEAEREYNKNIQKRQEVLGAGNPPVARYSPPSGAGVPPGPSPLTFLDRWLLPTYHCPMESRLGDWGDGGKVICMSHYSRPVAVPVVVSIGSNGDTSFEEAVFNEMGAITHTLDFSLKPDTAARVSSLEFIRFYSAGLSGAAELPDIKKKYEAEFGEVKWVTIKGMLELIKKDYVDVFKIDCEGCEYSVVKDLRELYDAKSVPFGQIQMELHFGRISDLRRPKKVTGWQPTAELLQSLEALGYRLFHVESNPYGQAYDYYNYELAFVHESLVKPR